MAEPPAHHKELARHVAESWPADVRIKLWSADGTAVRQAIAEAPDWPRAGLTSFATVGLSDHGGFELATVAAARWTSVVKALFDVASYVVDGGRVARPGEVFPKALSRYYTKSEIGHFLLSRALSSRLGLPPVGDGDVQWLYAVPITTDELILVEASGPAALEPHLENAEITTLADLDRQTVPGVPNFDPWG